MTCRGSDCGPATSPTWFATGTSSASRRTRRAFTKPCPRARPTTSNCDLALRGVDVDEGLRSLQAYDVRWGCDVLRASYDRTGGVDGRVSYEVDPRIAHDTDRTLAEAKAL